ncbi:MAG: bifunctional DNA-binding transcriptional regulator/O6-methylguanine-DNA methyltransferase Ada [Stappiaceae bacterium]
MTMMMDDQNRSGLENPDFWNAIEQRDATFDGRFVYGVRTTGIYCRPSCPSKAAKRINVSFHQTPVSAEAAGFRPCKRCKPHEQSQAERRLSLIAKACQMIEEAEETPSLDQLASAIGMSRFHFHRIFKQVTGVTPKAYAAACRAGRVRGALARGEAVTGAIYEAGYNASSRFYEESMDRLGMKPSQFRDGGRDVEIRFAVGECSLGSILVAATDKGVCAIDLGDDPRVLVRALEDRFPKAALVGGDGEFEQLVATVVGYVQTPKGKLELPLDVQGTAFQQRVWEALRQIPAGTTASYADIANVIGQPKAVRAVARACASNKIAIAIPCHRVIRSDGNLSGYRWGVERKQALIDREVTA